MACVTFSICIKFAPKLIYTLSGKYPQNYMDCFVSIRLLVSVLVYQRSWTDLDCNPSTDQSAIGQNSNGFLQSV